MNVQLSEREEKVYSLVLLQHSIDIYWMNAGRKIYYCACKLLCIVCFLSIYLSENPETLQELYSMNLLNPNF